MAVFMVVRRSCLAAISRLDLLEEVAVGEVLLAGVLQERGQLVREADQAETLQLLLDPLDLGGQRAHAVPSP